MIDLTCQSTAEKVPLRRTQSSPAVSPTTCNPLPPPTRFRRSKPVPATSDDTIITVSADKCPKIIRVATELSQRFGYEPSEICGRSLNILQGPKTDSKALHHAIKSACVFCPAALPLSLYSREGAERTMTVSCWPITSGDGEVTGCSLQIRDYPAHSPALIAQHEATWCQEKKSTLAYRRRYNFQMGLTINRIPRVRRCATIS